MPGLSIEEARELKERIAKVASQFRYQCGLAGTGPDRYSIAIRTQGRAGTKSTFMDALNKAGIAVDEADLDFQVTGQSRKR